MSSMGEMRIAGAFESSEQSEIPASQIAGNGSFIHDKSRSGCSNHNRKLRPQSSLVPPFLLIRIMLLTPLGPFGVAGNYVRV